jgi:hypothetical protein
LRAEGGGRRGAIGGLSMADESFIDEGISWLSSLLA